MREVQEWEIQQACRDDEPRATFSFGDPESLPSLGSMFVSLSESDEDEVEVPGALEVDDEIEYIGLSLSQQLMPKPSRVEVPGALELGEDEVKVPETQPKTSPTSLDCWLSLQARRKRKKAWQQEAGDQKHRRCNGTYD